MLLSPINWRVVLNSFSNQQIGNTENYYCPKQLPAVGHISPQTLTSLLSLASVTHHQILGLRLHSQDSRIPKAFMNLEVENS